jgi:hypothetical protein
VNSSRQVESDTAYIGKGCHHLNSVFNASGRIISKLLRILRREIKDHGCRPSASWMYRRSNTGFQKSMPFYLCVIFLLDESESGRTQAEYLHVLDKVCSAEV